MAEKLVNELHEWEMNAFFPEMDGTCKAFKTVKHFCTELEKGLKD